MELVASARLRRAQARIEAMRPFADRMLELMVGTARAAASVHGLPLLAAARREDRRHPPADRRPRPGRAVQHPGAPSRVRARPRLRRDGLDVALARRRPQGRFDAPLPSATRSTRPGRVSPTGPPMWMRRRSPTGFRAVRRRGDRPRGRHLQPLRVAARADRRRAGRAADLRRTCSPAATRRSTSRRCSATSSTSRSRRRSSPACCRSTSRPSSTARCSSRPPPSRRRG